MISFFQIENFKSLKCVILPLTNLNLMFGMNGMGKSSIIQALLMLRQSFWRNDRRHMNQLYVDDELVHLGTAKDILCQNADTMDIRFHLRTDDGNIIDLKYDTESFQETKSVINRTENYNEDSFSGALFSEKNFYYIGANHIGPQTYYDAKGWESISPNYLGTDGKFVIPFLAQYGEKNIVPKALVHPQARTNRLLDQVSAWMSEISPGIKLSAVMHPVTEAVQLRVSYEGELLFSDEFLPVNVGFGIPYVLPIIVELLISGEGTLLIIENPESHLHPKAQTAVAELIARAAENGAQIICESHSDHIINGIRCAVKDKILDNKKLHISYFDKTARQYTNVIPIQVDKNGNLSDYPPGLLDEWGNLMARLI